MLTDCMLRLSIHHYQKDSAWRLAYWWSCLHFFLLLQPCLWSSSLLSKVLSLRTALAPPQPLALPSGWLKSFNWGSGDTSQKTCASCLQTSTARATIVGQQRLFSPHLWGWHSKLVNTSLWQRGAIGAGTNSDNFKGSAGHYEFAAFTIIPQNEFPKPDIMSRICCHCLFFLGESEVVFVLLIEPFHSHLPKRFICHLHRCIVVSFYLFIYIFTLVLHRANHTCY